MKIVIKVLISAFLLWVVSEVVPGIEITNYLTAIVAFLIFSAINLFVKPILKLLTLPLNILTLGILGIIINILLFWMVASIVEGFEISSFITAALGLILYSLLQAVVNILE